MDSFGKMIGSDVEAMDLLDQALQRPEGKPGHTVYIVHGKERPIKQVIDEEIALLDGRPEHGKLVHCMMLIDLLLAEREHPNAVIVVDKWS